MRHRRYSGRVLYRQDRLGETGREWFTVTAHESRRTARAHCELDDKALLRDVTYTVDREFRPLDAYVGLTRGERFVGSAQCRFFEGGAGCQGFTATEGGFTQRVELAPAAALFAPQPLVTDGWQAAAFDLSRGPGRQQLDSCTNSSSRPHGGSGPTLGAVFKDKEFRGEQEVEVAAGRFRARRMRIRPLMGAMAAWPPLEFWIHGADCLLLRMRWELLESTFELVTLEGEVR